MTKAIQGNADGLCGLYALGNFLVQKGEVEDEPHEPEGAPKIALYHLCEAAERLGLFTPDKIFRGHPWQDLVGIFNEFARRFYTQFTAVPLKIVCHHLSGIEERDILIRILKENGSAVVSINEGRHWVLLKGMHGKNFTIVDPTYHDPQTIIDKTADRHDGLAILPHCSELLKELAPYRSAPLMETRVL